LSLIVSAFIGLSHIEESPVGIGAGALTLLFIGIHNAWDAVTYHLFAGKSNG